MTVHLSVSSITAGYQKKDVLHELRLSVLRGQIVSLIGPNGAGKSTFLLSLMGLVRSSGSIRYEGEEISGLPTEERVRMGMSLVSEKRDLFSALSVEDNLILGSYARNRADRSHSLDEVFSLFPRLKERRRQEALTLSGGERQMLAMGRALMAKPKLLLLDEPSLGLAPLIVRDIFTIIQRLQQAGISILLVEQNARAALEIASWGYVLELGSFVLVGSAAALAQDPRVLASYLGSADIGSAHYADEGRNISERVV
ncbi:ABC transporter ATP-binding protein [Sinorhizobium meliloti]|uniref:ABC transporter ATP-binding protein n=1 Tax=Rhizobium meliloti TaxID=382 RepID=UPI000FD46DFC|nr:ABC transporter ATP-binding protein [Sinorhizobium meliloti]MQV24883.1 ATP-binding cassette domain-containing protein [Sinorhizobium meliloti]MQV37447.1 ATP-binding cassette domain-containing protein [Sinorhizobium meliloti]RVE79246.1 ABC transporter ATP-binding protein [Sinorhizobium meliloti]RVG42680.1 ABC transporter ATP-binding protein [Sinorhizobium meliloti]RVM08274.1 ABC transporter ATP-binding protein [Sinorhizobium meliloti]